MRVLHFGGTSRKIVLNSALVRLHAAGLMYYESRRRRRNCKDKNRGARCPVEGFEHQVVASKLPDIDANDFLAPSLFTGRDWRSRGPSGDFAKVHVARCHGNGPNLYHLFGRYGTNREELGDLRLDRLYAPLDPRACGSLSSSQV